MYRYLLNSLIRLTTN